MTENRLAFTPGPFHDLAPPMPDPDTLIDGRYLSEMERRVMQGRYNCRGEYVLAPARPPVWPAEFTVPPPPTKDPRNAPEGHDEGGA